MVWLLSFAAAPADLAALKQSFLHPPDDARIMMRWWWFGSAVEKPELEREMRAMKEGGIGGVRSAAGVSADARRPGAGVEEPCRIFRRNFSTR